MKRLFFSAFLLVGLFACVYSQSNTNGHFYVLPGKVINGDTVFISTIREIYIFPRQSFSNRRQERRYWKLVRDLKIVYPYAKMARIELEELNRQFLSMSSAREQKTYAKQVEKRLRAEYEDQLKALTITQGRLLIKLIDRETGNTSFRLVKELRGSFQAAFWQTVARLFGSSLKVTYDANGNDREIEDILHKIDMGYL